MAALLVDFQSPYNTQTVSQFGTFLDDAFIFAN